MNWDDFQQSLTGVAPPVDLSPALQALWHDAQGNWQTAHDCLQSQQDRDSAWVHAYLHRKEGDLSNAGYWYRRAGQPVAAGPLEDERVTMTQTLLTVIQK